MAPPHGSYSTVMSQFCALEIAHYSHSNSVQLLMGWLSGIRTRRRIFKTVFRTLPRPSSRSCSRSAVRQISIHKTHHYYSLVRRRTVRTGAGNSVEVRIKFAAVRELKQPLHVIVKRNSITALADQLTGGFRIQFSSAARQTFLQCVHEIFNVSPSRGGQSRGIPLVHVMCVSKNNVSPSSTVEIG
jgi:hypothetical protein